MAQGGGTEPAARGCLGARCSPRQPCARSKGAGAGQSVLLPPPSPPGALPGPPMGCTAEGPVACPVAWAGIAILSQ